MGNRALAVKLYRDGDIVSPGGVLKAWAEWIKSKGDQAQLGLPSTSIEWRLMFSTRGGCELTSPEMAVDNLAHAAALGMWCAEVIKDCSYIQRRAVRHHYVDGMSYSSIAMQLGGRRYEGVDPMTIEEVQECISAAQERLRRAIKAVTAGLKIAA